MVNHIFGIPKELDKLALEALFLYAKDPVYKKLSLQRASEQINAILNGRVYCMFNDKKQLTSLLTYSYMSNETAITCLKNNRLLRQAEANFSQDSLFIDSISGSMSAHLIKNFINLNYDKKVLYCRHYKNERQFTPKVIGILNKKFIKVEEL